MADQTAPVPAKHIKDVEIYCLKCKTKHVGNKPQILKSKNRYSITDVCKETGTKMRVFSSEAKVRELNK